MTIFNGIVLAAIVPVGSAFAQCNGYLVDILPGPDCQFEPSDAHGSAVNQAGELSGSYYTCDKSGDAAVWLGQGSWIPLLAFPKGVSGFTPLDINASRLMAGYTTTQHPLREAAIYDFATSTFLQIGTLPGGNRSEAYGINEDGIVCGFSHGIGQPISAFVWQNGQVSALPLPFGPDSTANDISDSGLVCGWMGTGPHIDGHAFIHDLASQTTVDAGVILPSSIGSQATGVNNFGFVCGTSIIPCGKLCNLARSFIWGNGLVEDIGVLPPFTRTFAQAINDSNVIVGHCNDFPTSGLTRGFVWRNGQMQALNDLISRELNLDIRVVLDINNAGQIVGDATVIGGGGDRVAVRLTPIPSSIGDSDCDDDVDVDDLLCVINHWADASPKGSNALPPGDFDHDGIVELDDLSIVLDNWTF